jgi:hypothetical protein
MFSLDHNSPPNRLRSSAHSLASTESLVTVLPYFDNDQTNEALHSTPTKYIFNVPTRSIIFPPKDLPPEIRTLIYPLFNT